MKIKLSLKIIGGIILLMFLSLLTWAVQSGIKRKVNIAPRKAAILQELRSDYDPALLARFAGLCQKYDTLKYSYIISGTISLTNPSDTLQSFKNVAFFCQKAGNDFYYKLGQVEMVNQKGAYVCIDHGNRTITLSAQKDVFAPSALGALSGMGASLKGEDYSLSSKVQGRYQTISLINEHHISCKQYSVSFDTTNMQIHHIFARISQFSDPLNKSKDSKYDVQIDQWLPTRAGRLTDKVGHLVEKKEGEWVPAAQYSNYQFIKM